MNSTRSWCSGTQYSWPARPPQLSRPSPPKLCASPPDTCPGRAGQLYWVPLHHDRVLFMLHNPRYAGAYFYGRRRQVTDVAGHHRTLVKPRQDWTTLIPGAHPGYISWEQFEANQATLIGNAAAHGQDRKAGPAREGPALLQGLVLCGKCGKRMTVGYHRRCDGTLVPDYACQREGIATGTPPCQTTCGAGIDAAVADLVLQSLTPLALETALAVSTELTGRAAEADRIRATGVQRARYAAEAARPRYPAAGTQTPHPAARHRRHPDPQQRAHHRPRPATRRTAAHPHRPPTPHRLGAAHHP